MESLLPKNLLKTTVAICVQKEVDKKIQHIPIGTGFLINYQNKIILITCAHIANKDKGNFHILFNLKNGNISTRSLEEIKTKYNITWRTHKNFDISAIIFGINPKDDDLLLIPEKALGKYEDINIGADVFFLGYPLSITSKESAFPLARSGIIATKLGEDIFLIDGNAYPGNSGGPVFSKPSIFNFETKVFGKIIPPKLLGIISEMVSYQDVAISQQTKRPRVIFEENASLAKVIDSNKILELLQSDDFQKYLAGETRP